MAAPSDSFNRTSLAEQVHDALREEIITGRLAPNDRIDLNYYAKQWSVSPTPLRDAVRQLETAGLVEVSPRRGVFIATLDRESLKEIFELRIAIECTAIRLATKNIPADKSREVLRKYAVVRDCPKEERERHLSDIDLLIHDTALEYCGNRRLQRMMESVHDLIRWSRQSVIRSIPEPFEVTLPEHIEICQAVCDGDGEHAAGAMYRHLENSFERISVFLNNQTKMEE